jgi:hypothetical protein
MAELDPVVKEFLDAFWDAHPNVHIGNTLVIDVDGLGGEFMAEVVKKFKELYDADSPYALNFLDRIIKSYEEPADADEPHVIVYESGGIEKVFDLNSFYEVGPPFGDLLRIISGIHTLISEDPADPDGTYDDSYVSLIENCKSLERDPNSPEQAIINIVGEIFSDTEKYAIPEDLDGHNYFDGDLGYVADYFIGLNGPVNNNNQEVQEVNNQEGGRRRRKTRKAKRSKQTKKARRHRKGKTGKKQRKGRRTHRRS